MDGGNGDKDTYARRVKRPTRTKGESLAWLIFVFHQETSLQNNRLSIKSTRFTPNTTVGLVYVNGGV